MNEANLYKNLRQLSSRLATVMFCGTPCSSMPAKSCSHTNIYRLQLVLCFQTQIRVIHRIKCFIFKHHPVQLLSIIKLSVTDKLELFLNGFITISR